MQYEHFFRIVGLLKLTRTKWREVLIGTRVLNWIITPTSFHLHSFWEWIYWFLCPLYLQMLSHWEKRDTMLSAIDRNTVHLVHTLKTVWRVVCKVAIARVLSLWIKKGGLSIPTGQAPLKVIAALSCNTIPIILRFWFGFLWSFGNSLHYFTYIRAVNKRG